MSNEQQIQDAVARCVSIVACYWGDERTRHSTIRMAAEARTLATEVREMELGPRDVAERVLRPVEGELLARFGHELGARLNAEFVEAYEGYGRFDLADVTERRYSPSP